MINIHILLVEDDSDAQNSFRETVEIFNARELHHKNRRIESIESAQINLDQAERDRTTANLAYEANSTDSSLKKAIEQCEKTLKANKKIYEELCNPKSAIDELNNHKQKFIEFTIKNSLHEVQDLSIKEFLNIDIIIMDIQLDKLNPNGGNEAVEFLASLYSRVPIICVSGTPENIADHPLVIRKRARDEQDYDSDIDFAFRVKMTGLIDILKGKGHINETLYNALIISVIPNLSDWLQYINTLQYTQIRDGVFRVFSNHINKIIENSQESFILQEFYINLTDKEVDNKKNIKTGYILKRNNTHYVALNPPCDLTVRKDDSCKTDRLFLCEVESFVKYIESNYKKAYQQEKNKISFITKKLDSLIKNNASYNHHFLPQNAYFESSCLDFVKIITVLQNDLEANYEIERIMIAPSFVANITSRLASYYARQGQPDIRLNVLQKDKVVNTTIAAIDEILQIV